MFFFILKTPFQKNFLFFPFRGKIFAGSAGFAAPAAAMYIQSPDVAPEGRITK
jgi:hypothetical protein